LIIVWDKKVSSTGRSLPIGLKIVEVHDVKFDGKPTFTNQWPQKYYDVHSKTWSFVDDIGTLYQYQVESKKA
jgi:hypothetical protein